MRISPPLYVLLLTGSLLLPLAGCGGSPEEDVTDTGAAQEPAESASGETERVAADVGVGVKGRSLDGYKGGVEGVIAAPAQQYFKVKEDLVFNAQVKPAIQLFKATHGKGPESHEQFMAEIIKKNGIQLPPLPEGQSYVYDPETEQLMVERPVQQ